MKLIVNPWFVVIKGDQRQLLGKEKKGREKERERNRERERETQRRKKTG